MSRNVMYMG